MTTESIKQTELTQSERDVLRADTERWRNMGSGGHLDDWLAYYPGLDIRRRLAMKLAFTNRPEGKGYVLNFNQLMRDDGFDTNDKTNMSHMSAVLWLRDNPEHEKVLREIREAMSPGQRSRLNTPIAARQRVKAELERREKERHGTVDEMEARSSPLAIYKKQIAEQNRKIAHLEEQLAAAENDTSLFDLKRSSADEIVRVMTDPTAISQHKATTIAKGILAAFKTRQKPAG
jgi:hypothetical protein